MHEWKCPHCGKSMFSACEKADDKKVKCIYCKRLFINPYHEGLIKKEKKA